MASSGRFPLLLRRLAPLVLFAVGCAELPVDVEPLTEPVGLRLEWDDERPGAVPWIVLAGEGVRDLVVAPGSGELRWYGADDRRYVLRLRATQGVHARRRPFAMTVEGVVGRTADGRWIAIGSDAPAVVAKHEGRIAWTIPHRLSHGVAAGDRLRATADLEPARRARSWVALQAGADLWVGADGTVAAVGRSAPALWERRLQSPYPGQVLWQSTPSGHDP